MLKTIINIFVHMMYNVCDPESLMMRKLAAYLIECLGA